MKKSWIVLMFGLAASGCIKNDIEKNCGEVKTKAPDAEVATLKAYLDSKGIAATQDPRGFFYKIEPEGSGTKPTVCSQITVDYVGKLTNDSTFDSQTDISFPLNGVITGWQEACLWWLRAVLFICIFHQRWGMAQQIMAKFLLTRTLFLKLILKASISRRGVCSLFLSEKVACF